MRILNDYVKRWVESSARFLKPDQIYWCDGSDEEEERLTKQAVEEGILKPLNPIYYPNSYLYRSADGDAGPEGVESFLCTESEKDRSDSFSWRPPQEMYEFILQEMQGAMEGRTLYVVPYIMGPANSPFARVGIELTDSLYTVLNMFKLSRIGDKAWKIIGDRNDFFRGVHSKGSLDRNNRLVVHFPDRNLCYSFNMEYGGYAFQTKASVAMINGSYWASREGWLAEHMTILEVESPRGRLYYFAGAFPSFCGKSNLAFMKVPPYAKGYKCRTISDDSAWLHLGPDGRLWAVNPETGFFSNLAGVNAVSTPNAYEAVKSDTIFSNVALDSKNRPWWRKKTAEPEREMTDWRGRKWVRGQDDPENLDHINSRFSVAGEKMPSLSKHWEEPTGVPISAFIFGGRSSDVDPLVREARNWSEGLYYGLTLQAERQNDLIRNPFGMMQFMGSDLGSYLENWLSLGRNLVETPKIFRVNWFRKDSDGHYVWPGFCQNFRVIEWMIKRIDGQISAHKTPLGLIPQPGDLNFEGLDMPKEASYEALFGINKDAWIKDRNHLRAYLNNYENLPRFFYDEMDKEAGAIEQY